MKNLIISFSIDSFPIKMYGSIPQGRLQHPGPTIEPCSISGTHESLSLTYLPFHHRIYFALPLYGSLHFLILKLKKSKINKFKVEIDEGAKIWGWASRINWS